MTRYLRDILQQPDELQKTLEYLSGAGRHTLNQAASLLRKARHVYLTGIGSSWNAAIAWRRARLTLCSNSLRFRKRGSCYCSYIVETEYGLMNDKVVVPKEGS
jgi:glucosamine 6-phosphate synthetase-like amidotransferase/phosphosugar isomerase protein